jgi:hypothetical protein
MFRQAQHKLSAGSDRRGPTGGPAGGRLVLHRRLQPGPKRPHCFDKLNTRLYNAYWDGLVRNAYNAILASIPASQPPEYRPGNLQIVIEPATGTGFLPGQEQQAPSTGSGQASPCG